MTNVETAKIMMAFQTAYPRYYAGKTDADIEASIKLWRRMLEQYDYNLVESAVLALIATQKFPPTIAEVIEKIQYITTPQEMTEMEAWQLVRKAIRGATMDASSRKMINGVLDERTSAERNFEALPPVLQRLAGSPGQLAEWEKLDDSQIETVLQSNFIRSYTARTRREKEFDSLPNAVRRLMQSKPPAGLPGGEEGSRHEGEH